MGWLHIRGHGSQLQNLKMIMKHSSFMQTGWIKTKNSVKDEDNPEDLYKTKNEEVNHIGPIK